MIQYDDILSVLTKKVRVYELTEEEAQALYQFFLKYVGYIDEENNPLIKPLIRQLGEFFD